MWRGKWAAATVEVDEVGDDTLERLGAREWRMEKQKQVAGKMQWWIAEATNMQGIAGLRDRE